MHPALSNRDLVNINGEPWRPSFDAVNAKPRPKRDAPTEFHKGWRVDGVSPKSIKEAEESRPAEIDAAMRHNKRIEDGLTVSHRVKVPRPWNLEEFVASAKRTAVRSKPYEIRDSAEQCAELARRGGWMGVEIREIKKCKSA